MAMIDTNNDVVQWLPGMTDAQLDAYIVSVQRTMFDANTKLALAQAIKQARALAGVRVP